MRNLSIFSENIRYIQHEPITPHKLDIDSLDYRHKKELYLKLKGFPITGQGFASGKLLDGIECQFLLDMGATKSYMSKSYYL